MAVTQKPIAPECFGEPIGPAAWPKLPSWYLLSKQDKAINPDLQRFMVKRIKATTIEVNSSHASPVSHPGIVVGLIEAAIKHYQKKL
jgi:pimeloyl-ACP methyl ester carboxylesterase